MPPTEHPHIFLANQKNTASYTPVRRAVPAAPPAPPVHDQHAHSQALEAAYRAALQAVQAQYQEFGVNPADADGGVTVELELSPGSGIDVGILEDARGRFPIEVLNVKFDDQGEPTSAILYIPPTRTDFISKQLTTYGDPEKNTKKGARHRKKYDKTEDVQPVVIADFWIDYSPLPDNQQQALTWEVWLRADQFESFRQRAALLENVTVSEHFVGFPERQICAVHCSLRDLARLELYTKAITGFRFLRTGGGFFEALPPAEQQAWLDDLIPRLEVSENASASVCLLDTGIAHEHPLLQLAIAENGVDSCNPADWGTHDHDGHGTEMAGIAMLGDLTPVLESQDPVPVPHVIESVKTFPVDGDNEDEHIAYITTEAVYRAEVNRPDLTRAYCVSWTIEHEAQRDGASVIGGRPTPLSAKIDQLAFGVEELGAWDIHDEKKRLFVISAGNIRDPFDAGQYPAINDLSEIEEPAQAWNALTVSAYTSKMFTTDPTYNGWEAVAGNGLLSPKSRTSVMWGDSYWPTKPDVVLEGGNCLHNGAGYMQPVPDTCLWTADKDQIFCSTGDSSAANAEAARLAAHIATAYPGLWPETVRGLLVHAAEWTDGMLAGANLAAMTKPQKISFLRRYGYGVPQPERLIASLSNRPTIVIQDELQPFTQSDGANPYVKFGDMTFYQLPWPVEQLQDILEQVRLRVTLSYFIEPNPSERPPTTKYSYASHELRFRINRPNEPQDEFLGRINEELRQAEEEAEDGAEVEEAEDAAVANQDRWLLRPQTRDRGGVISDIWTGTGAELATQNLIAVVPQLGWWKYRKGFPNKDDPRFARTIRYSLFLTLISEAEVDLYTPITQQIAAAAAAVVEV